MGGSLSLALKKYGFNGKLTGIVRSQKSVEEVKPLNMVDELYKEQDFLEKSSWNEFDLIIFSLPVDLTCAKINQIPDDYKGFITDLGSTKKEILKAVSDKFPNLHNYYSSHPMAGSENSGATFSNAELYKGKLCILTRDLNTSDDAVKYISSFWKELGSHTLEIPAQDHDTILAYLSHTPHILSSLMVSWADHSDLIQKYSKLSDVPLSGGGFRDMSRIAGSNPEMWEAIISTNRDAIYLSLKKFQNDLSIIINELEKTNASEGYWKDYFEKSKIARDRILKIEHKPN